MMKVIFKILRRPKVFLIPWVCFCFVMFFLYAKDLLFTNRKDKIQILATATTNLIAKSNILSSNICKNLTFPGHMTTDRWQNIGTNGTGFVYSAFREINTIRIIGISQETGLLVCQLWYTKPARSSKFAISVKAVVKPIHLMKEMGYMCTIFECMVPQEDNGADLIGVSVSELPCHQPTNVLPVIRRGYGHVRKNHVQNRHSNVTKYTICVSPLHDNYNRAYELIEWIELNKILGADKFIFYNLSCTPFISQIINSYAKVGTVSVLDWHLPIKMNKRKNGNVKYFAQLSALNDCLFRNRGHSEFVLNIDIDEFIIPRSNNVLTWDEMLQQWPKHDVYLFLHAFFMPKWVDSWRNYSMYQSARKLNLVTLLRLTRDLKVHDMSERTKYFARTRTTNMLGIHKVLRTSGKMLLVPQSSALLQHYRRRCKNAIPGPVDDTILKKYKDSLIQSVSDKWNSLDNEAH